MPVDIDGDGDLDWVLHTLQGLRLVENTLPPQHFARVRLLGNRTLGAVVELSAGGVTQRDYVHLTDGFQSQVPSDLHFGLGSADEVSLVVHWPGGETQALGPLPSNRLLTISQGRAAKVSELPRWPTQRPVPDKFSFDVSAQRLAGDGSASLATTGTPVVINFWASWCDPCKEELPMLAALAKATPEVQFVGVTVDKDNPAAAKATVKSLSLDFPQFIANEELVASFFGASGEVPLPATFVFDPTGKLQRAFQRPISKQELEPLLASLAQADVHADDMETHAGALALQGRFEEALEWLEKVVAVEPDHEKAYYEMGLVLSQLGRNDEAIRAWKRAIELFPDNTHALHNLADTLAQTGKPGESLEWYDRYLALVPGDPITLHNKGNAAANANQLDVARDAFVAATRADPQSTDLWMALARVHWMRRDKASARSTLEHVLQLDPTHDKARELLKTVQ